ncbi:MAG: GspMb/PilO family protein [Deltaproteobacteria bacterium]|jgi:hypothetical protein
MLSTRHRLTNFPENKLLLLLVLVLLMIFLLVRQIWWRPLEREIKFLENEVLISQSELKNFPVQKLSQQSMLEKKSQSPAKVLQALQELIKNYEIQILQQNLYAINDSQDGDVFEIFLSLEANYQNLTKWLERFKSEKNFLYVTKMNVKNLATSDVFPKIQIDLTVQGYQISQ